MDLVQPEFYTLLVFTVLKQDAAGFLDELKHTLFAHFR